MKDTHISEAVTYIGVDDKELDLFESQYNIPNGVSYNSYLILDEKTAVMDTVDARKSEEWQRNLEEALSGRTPDYLVVSHMEPDHGACIQALAEKYPGMQLVGNAKTFTMLGQFFDLDVSGRTVAVGEGESLNLGSHTLHFYLAPMVHWPEVMVTYESTEKILFSADGFGKFGALDTQEEWTDEARRYYFNIVGKYGVQVQSLLKKAAGLEINAICPLHGPVLKENLRHCLEKYSIWSSYEPEEKGILVAHASIHGNTKAAAEKLAGFLKEAGETQVELIDLTRDDMSKAVEEAFRYDRLVLASATYDGGIFPCMEDFLHHLKAKNYQKRTVALMENGSWGPQAARLMRNILESMKDITVLQEQITIKSTVKEANIEQMKALAKHLV